MCQKQKENINPYHNFLRVLKEDNNTLLCVCENWASVWNVVCFTDGIHPFAYQEIPKFVRSVSS